MPENGLAASVALDMQVCVDFAYVTDVAPLRRPTLASFRAITCVRRIKANIKH